MVRRPKVRRAVRLRALLALTPFALAASAACDRDAPLAPPDATPPETKSAPAAPAAPGRAPGLVEVTITGIGTANPSATAVPYGRGAAGALAGVHTRADGPGAAQGSAGGPGAPGASASPGAAGVRFALGPVSNNTALALDGAGDYVRADGVSDALAGTAALTLEAWVRPEAESGGQQAVLAFHTSANDNRNVLFYEPDRDGFAYHDAETDFVRTGEAFPPGRWVHVAVVIDGSGQGTLYIDGTAHGTFTTTVRPEAGGRFSIGQEYDAATATDFLRGRIDEVRVWNVARSEAELEADMGREIDPATPGLVAYYRFGEASGTTAADLAGDNDGTLVGDPAFGAPGPVIDGVTNGDGTIQLEPLSTGSFTDGERGTDGFRYLYATFRVRNAQQDGTPYATPRENLTFLGVDTDGTHGHTAVSRLATFGGTEITGTEAVAIAEGMIPTGAAYQRSDGAIRSIEPDVLQVLTEGEAGAIDRTGTAATDLFPYGFVVRTPGVTPGSRTLPGSPAAGQFDGRVTFAFKVPLQASPADDPFEISAVFLPVDDTETRLTQSFEEQGPEAVATFEARAAELFASEVTLLPGGTYRDRASVRVICEPVRVAGAQGAATGLLFPDPPAFLALSPDPYAPDGAGSRIASTASISATFDHPVDGADATTFVVHGAQSGTAFLAEPYTGAGTTTIAAPAGSFLPGEVVEVTLTPELGYCPARFGRVAHYRVAAGTAGGTFAADPARFVATGGERVVAGDLDGDGDLDVAVASGDLGRVSVLLEGGGVDSYPVGGSIPRGVTAADLDNDGDLDLATANLGSDDVSVFMNDGAGTFALAATYPVVDGAAAIAAGDLDGDGDLDLAAAAGDDPLVSVLLNAGDGTFAAAAGIEVNDAPVAVAAGDLDGDGDLDLAVVNSGSDNVSILENPGDPANVQGEPYTVGDAPSSVAIADLDGDGDLDLAVTNRDADDVSVLLNAGDGTFAAAVNFTVGDGPGAIAAGDLDGDGDLDLATVNLGSDNVSILENVGAATFTAATTTGAGVANPRAIAVGDADGDLDLDLFVAAEGGVATLLNN